MDSLYNVCLSLVDDIGTICLNAIDCKFFLFFFFFQAEDGIRDVLGSRGLGDVYKRQDYSGI